MSISLPPQLTLSGCMVTLSNVIETQEALWISIIRAFQATVSDSDNENIQIKDEY